MNAMNGRSGCNCSGAGTANYQGSMNNHRNGRCRQGNCGMSEAQMDNLMNQCQNDPSQRGSSDPMYGMPLGIGYVPWQCWGNLYDLEEGLCNGTIFPELNLQFFGCIPKGWSNGRGGRS